MYLGTSISSGTLSHGRVLLSVSRLSAITINNLINGHALSLRQSRFPGLRYEHDALVRSNGPLAHEVEGRAASIHLQ